MRIFRGPFSLSGAATFFFFSWVIQVLFNSIVVGHFGLLKPLNYWQAASLWFLAIITFAWSGRGLSRTLFGLLEFDRGDLYGLEIGLFFLGAWIFQVIFNSLIVGYFGFLSPLNYWQAAGLLFLVTLFTFWFGFAVSPRPSKKWDYSELGKRIKEELKRFFEEW